MEQKQLDEENSLEEKKDLPEENDDLSEKEEEIKEIPEETEEKMNDVNEILDNKKTEKTKETEEKEAEEKPEPAEEKKEQTTETKKTAEEADESKKDDWDDDKDETKPGSTWKVISGILLILLIAAIYTNGFNFGSPLTGATITRIDAEDKVLDYVNTNLIRPPFTAEVISSEELGNLFKVTLKVAGQEVDSYLTKDGKYFFPQGFDLEAPPLELEPEEAEIVDVSLDDDPVLGQEDAPVTIVEFSDFQCPFCKRGWETIKQVEEEYVETGKVKIVFRDFPLGFHPQAKPAAMAAQCAYEQNKFWEYHNLLFENQPDLSPENYKKWAAQLGLDTRQFNDCLDSQKYKEEVEADFADGQSYGVSGTPAFFINGKLLTGAQPYSAFKSAIEEALQVAEEPELEEQLEEVAEVIEKEIEPEPAEAQPPEPTPEIKEIQITATRWTFKPRHLEANQGDQVRLIVTSELDLNFLLPAFNLEEEILAGQTKTLEFTADKKGTFEFNCGDYCLKKYSDRNLGALNGELIIE